MKTQRNILIAFILNLVFAVFEFLGGMITGSVAIVSDAVHDVGDALSIGISYFLEKKAQKHPDEEYTYGYRRYSVIGGFITSLILLIGSTGVIYNAVSRIIVPVKINYNGMIIFAVVGVCVNLGAVFFTRNGESFNQRAVNLHMLEDVLGWGVVLVGAVIMRFTNFTLIDPVMSIGVSLFVIIHTLKNLKGIMDLFLLKVPRGIKVSEIKEHIEKIDEVLDIYHIHVWSMDGQNNIATMHVVTESGPQNIKEKIRKELYKYRITHATIELERGFEYCGEKSCRIEFNTVSGHCHHH